MNKTQADIPGPQNPVLSHPPEPEATCSVRLSERDAAEVEATAERPPFRTKRPSSRATISAVPWMRLRIEFLTAGHERAAFDCGKSSLNSFIHLHAPLNHERGVSRIYVAVRGPQQQVLAYYASSAGSFLRDHLPPDDRTGLPRYPLPTAHLGDWPSIFPAGVNVSGSCCCSIS